MASQIWPCTIHSQVVGVSVYCFVVSSQDAFILDTGSGGLFAWLGKKATQQEKKAAFKNAVVCTKYTCYY